MPISAFVLALALQSPADTIAEQLAAVQGPRDVTAAAGKIAALGPGQRLRVAHRRKAVWSLIWELYNLAHNLDGEVKPEPPTADDEAALERMLAAGVPKWNDAAWTPALVGALEAHRVRLLWRAACLHAAESRLLGSDPTPPKCSGVSWFGVVDSGTSVNLTPVTDEKGGRLPVWVHVTLVAQAGRENINAEVVAVELKVGDDTLVPSAPPAKAFPGCRFAEPVRECKLRVAAGGRTRWEIKGSTDYLLPWADRYKPMSVRLRVKTDDEEFDLACGIRFAELIENSYEFRKDTRALIERLGSDKPAEWYWAEIVLDPEGRAGHDIRKALATALDSAKGAKADRIRALLEIGPQR